MYLQTVSLLENVFEFRESESWPARVLEVIHHLPRQVRLAAGGLGQLLVLPGGEPEPPGEHGGLPLGVLQRHLQHHTLSTELRLFRDGTNNCLIFP